MQVREYLSLFRDKLGQLLWPTLLPVPFQSNCFQVINERKNAITFLNKSDCFLLNIHNPINNSSFQCDKIFSYDNLTCFGVQYKA